MEKKRLVISYSKLSQELKELAKRLYPDGVYNHLSPIQTPSQTIYTFPLETDTVHYLVKMPVEPASTPHIDLDARRLGSWGQKTEEE